MHYLIVIAYLILAPTLFFLPLYSFRGPMKRAKDKALAYISELFEFKYRQLFRLTDSNGRDSALEILAELTTINAAYDLAKKMPA